MKNNAHLQHLPQPTASQPLEPGGPDSPRYCVRPSLAKIRSRFIEESQTTHDSIINIGIFLSLLSITSTPMLRPMSRLNRKGRSEHSTQRWLPTMGGAPQKLPPTFPTVPTKSLPQEQRQWKTKKKNNRQMEKHCDSIWVIAVNHLYLHRQMKDIAPFITVQYTITLQS